MVYAFSKHKAQLYATSVLCTLYPLIFGFYHGRDYNVVPFEVSRFVNVTVAYHSRVIRKARCFECLVRDPNDDILLVKLALNRQTHLQIFIGRVFRLSKWILEE